MWKTKTEREKRERESRQRRPSGTPHPQEVDRAPQGLILVQAGSGRRGPQQWKRHCKFELNRVFYSTFLYCEWARFAGSNLFFFFLFEKFLFALHNSLNEKWKIRTGRLVLFRRSIRAPKEKEKGSWCVHHAAVTDHACDSASGCTEAGDLTVLFLWWTTVDTTDVRETSADTRIDFTFSIALSVLTDLSEGVETDINSLDLHQNCNRVWSLRQIHTFKKCYT